MRYTVTRLQKRIRARRPAAKFRRLGWLVVALGTACASESLEVKENCGDPPCEPSRATPAVLSITPEDGDIGAEPKGVVRIRFNTELDAGCVSAENVVVLEGNEAVPGKLTYADTQITFAPSADLALLATYRVLIKAGLTSAGGIPMGREFASEFTVRDGTWTSPSSVGRSWLSGLSADAAGGFVLGWEAENVAHVRNYSGGRWKEDDQVLCTSCLRSSLGGNSHGDAVAVALDFDGIARAKQFRQGTWQADSDEVCHLTSYVPQAAISATVAPTGEVRALFVDGDTVRTRHTDRYGVWSGGTDTAGSIRSAPVLAFNDAGTGFVAWTAYDEASETSAARFVRLPAADNVVDTIPSSVDAGDALGALTMAVASNGEAEALWVSAGALMASHYTGTGWSSEAPPTGSETAGICAQPSVVFDGEVFVAAWGQLARGEDTPCIVHTSRRHDGSWEDSGVRSDSRSSAAVSEPLHLRADAWGNLTLLWTASGQATYVRFNHATTTWSAPVSAFPGHVSVARSLVGASGTLLAAFENGGNVETALFR